MLSHYCQNSFLEKCATNEESALLLILQVPVTRSGREYHGFTVKNQIGEPDRSCSLVYVLVRRTMLGVLKKSPGMLPGKLPGKYKVKVVLTLK